MTRIALIRHFPTDWNAELRLQGRTDRPLTDASRAELGRLALPPPWNGVRIVASPLARAHETARLLAPGAAIETDPRLLELTWGAWEGQTQDDLRADATSGFVPTGDLGWDRRPPGGESLADGWARVHPLMRTLARDPEPTLLVTHKALMRAILRVAAGPAAPEVKRARLYPMTLDPDGTPVAIDSPVRLVPR